MASYPRQEYLHTPDFINLLCNIFQARGETFTLEINSPWGGLWDTQYADFILETVLTLISNIIHRHEIVDSLLLPLSLRLSPSPIHFPTPLVLRN